MTLSSEPLAATIDERLERIEAKTVAGLTQPGRSVAPRRCVSSERGGCRDDRPNRQAKKGEIRRLSQRSAFQGGELWNR